ncbi:hypothetical protein GCM10027290_15560 [Micromonospora sonneratiae]|uniref:Adhesin n=1 Tax=Micromonospora sonneratiae TaxID=1184706 RepID=A0ABW3YET6_9ACTN
MSDIERGSGEQHPDLDEFVDDWDEAEPESKPSRWSRLTRGRPAMPLMAAGCVGVLVILIGIVIGGQVGSDSETPPSSGSGPSAEAPPIDFVPVGDGEEETSPSPSSDASPTASPTSTTSASPGTDPTSTASPRPNATPTGAPKPTTGPTTPKVTFAAVSGYSCPQNTTRGFRVVGRYTEDGKEGWYSVGSGAWTSDGCGGAYEAMPMSGSKTKDDNFYGEWWFAVGSATRSCAVSTYVPSTSDPRNVSGKPATYQVRDTEGGAIRATFTVDQRVNRGRWVSAGTYAVNGGRIVIRAVNRGEDWNDSGRTLEHIAVAQLRVTCQ